MACPLWLTARPIAHRGLHDATAGIPENTLASAEAAIARGFSIEVDIQPSSDDLPVVFHDTSLERLTAASGPVAARSAAALSILAISGTDQTIPSLGDLLDVVDGRVPLILEIKTKGRQPGPFEAAVTHVLERYRGPAALMSFDPATVAAVARMAPRLPRGLISYDYRDDAARQTLGGFSRWWRRNLLPILTTRPDFVAYDARTLPNAATTLARRLGLPVLSWTVRSPVEERRLAPHVDQVIFEGYIPEPRMEAE